MEVGAGCALVEKVLKVVVVGAVVDGGVHDVHEGARRATGERERERKRKSVWGGKSGRGGGRRRPRTVARWG